MLSFSFSSTNGHNNKSHTNKNKKKRALGYICTILVIGTKREYHYVFNGVGRVNTAVYCRALLYCLKTCGAAQAGHVGVQTTYG